MAKTAPGQMFICGLCEESFTSKEECTTHTKSVHQSQPQAATAATVPTVSDPPVTSQEEQPPPAKKMKKSSAVASKKANASSGPKLSDPSLAGYSDEEIFAKLMERNATFVCKCGLIFRDQPMFYLHRGTHSSQNPYQCSFCRYVAPNWYDFTSHFYFHSNSKIHNTSMDDNKDGAVVD